MGKLVQRNIRIVSICRPRESDYFILIKLFPFNLFKLLSFRVLPRPVITADFQPSVCTFLSLHIDSGTKICLGEDYKTLGERWQVVCVEMKRNCRSGKEIPRKHCVALEQFKVETYSQTICRDRITSHPVYFQHTPGCLTKQSAISQLQTGTCTSKVPQI